MGQLKTFRDAGVSLFNSAATTLREAGSTQDSEKVQKWSDDWFSILGVNRGLTGLAKDFVVNYLGRSAYHDSNGPLLEAIKKVAATYPGDVDEDDIYYLRKGVLSVCNEGLELFQSGGSLHGMLS